MSKIAIYARKSTESEDRQVLSLDSQISELKSYAESQGLVISEIYRESKSAKAPGRPIFDDMIKKIQCKKIDSVLCWKLDRLARNPIDGGNIIWALEEEKLKSIHTPQREFLNTGNDKFWMALEFGISKKYVDDLSDNVKRGLKARLERGWIPGRPPLGYLNDKENRTIIKDPERFLLVRRMWDLMLSGNYTPNTILKIATEEWGLRTRKHKRFGGGPVGYSEIYKIFTNPFYYGKIVRKGELHQGAHPPMITKSEFDRVQDELHRSSNKRPKRHSFAYTGMIKCGECGAGVTAEHRINRYGYHYVYYHCTKRKRTVRCSQKYIQEQELERQISQFLQTITIADDFKDWAIKVLRDIHEEEQGKNIAASKSLHKRYTEIKTELSELMNIRLRGLLSDQEYLEKKEELENEQNRLKEMIEDSEHNFEDLLDKCEKVFEFACHAKSKFENGTLKEKRTILNQIGSNLVLRNKKLHILPQKPFLIIKKGIASGSANIAMFEPSKNSYTQQRNPYVKTPKDMIYRLRDSNPCCHIESVESWAI